VRDIVGLYLNPPDKAIVLSVDEKSQIQALDPANPAASARLTADPAQGPQTAIWETAIWDRTLLQIPPL
jgi:hypothetical protein